MKSSWVVIFFALSGCGGDDDDTCPSGDPCECYGICPDGRDADADADGDGGDDGTPATAVLHIETWTLSPDGTPRDLPGAQAEVDGVHCTTPCDLELPTGNHDLFLSMPGWVQGPNPLPFSLTTESVVVNGIPTSIVDVSGLTVRHRLDRRLEGRYRRESDGLEVSVTFYPATRLGYMCPESFSGAGPFQPLGSLCIEGETLSLCKTHASECGTSFAEGQILEDGRRVEFTSYHTGIPNSYVYLKVD